MRKWVRWTLRRLPATVLVLAGGLAHASSPGEPQAFDSGWLFARDAQPGAELPGFPDKDWQSVTLPHDWSIAGPFDPKYNARMGGLPVHGTGWYRKHFTIPASVRGKVVRLRFDGAISNSSIWVNGQLIGKRPNGYLAMDYDISKFLNYGGSNVVSVELEPQNASSRWYTGAGINRDVWLEIDDPVHLDKAETVLTMPHVDHASATLAVSAAIDVPPEGARRTALIMQLVNAAGEVVSTNRAPVQALERSTIATVPARIMIARPHLWSVDDPYLYTLHLSLVRDGQTIDTMTLPVGLRSVVFTANDGMLLNGQRVPIRGVCMHEDNGALGTVANRRAIERKLQLFKAMGVNAIRTSHNPPPPVLVELANQMGFLLDVEAFDAWRVPKKGAENGYNVDFDTWHERDLSDMIKQYRNAPSVMMWSIGNEVADQATRAGASTARELATIARRIDPTRPVTAAYNVYPTAEVNGLTDALDIVGLNYKADLYADTKRRHPEWIVMGSETASTVSTRGVYHLPLVKYDRHPDLTISSYDNIGPPWSDLPDYEWQKLAETPAILGEFIWTGIDYLGEPTPYGGRDNIDGGTWNSDWPARSSTFGAIDLAGFPKDRFFLYQSHWTTRPMVHLLPDWNWPGKEGEPIPVMVYTNGDSAELFLNGQSLGIKVKGRDTVPLPVIKRFSASGIINSPYRLLWDVPYSPGTLKVVAYRNGKAIAQDTVVTAGPPARVVLSPDRSQIAADGRDLSFVTATIVDKDGNIVPGATNLIRFKVTGAGQIAAVDNGDATSLDPFQANFRSAYHGKALLIVRSNDAPGAIEVVASSERLKSGEATLSAR